MSATPTNLGALTPIHTDFGSNTGDLLVVEYDVPQTKVKKTLFYKHGQLSIPKWALIPAGILMFGSLIALCAIIVNAILSQKSTSVTYSQTCSKISICKTSLGLTCGSQSVCVCQATQYWYENQCVAKPTYTHQCNQTTECRTDLGLICAEYEGQCNCPNTTIVQTCDCSSTSYWTGSACTPRLTYLGVCSVANTSYQCLSNLYCDGSKCTCSPGSQYWNYTANECYSVDQYRSLCNLTTSYSCNANASLYCLSAGEGSQCPYNVTAGTTSCDCANGTYWNGGSCVTKKISNVSCFWDCECNSAAGLQCLNTSCTCPQKTHWSSLLSSCVSQLNYTQPCSSTADCDASQGLICYTSGGTQCNCPVTSSLNTCDCATPQFYDYNRTSCQSALLYNETCYNNYMCDSTLGLFCQTTISSAANCSCPEPIRLNMCDCNTTSYWNGIACVSRLAANISCSYDYQCQASFVCIINQTSIGIFSDVCRCPIGSYYVNGSGCAVSKNYTQSCIGSYQCYELSPLTCRYNDTGLSCLDSSVSPLPACDCSDYYYFDTSTNLCLPFLNRSNTCTSSCQCTPPYLCVSGICDCFNFYSSINQTCVQFLSYSDQCTNNSQCSATPNALMICVNGTCGCNSTGYWSGTQCQFTNNFRGICTTDANCYTGLKCQSIPCIDANKRCSCPPNTYYSTFYHNCSSCSGTNSGYQKYVINYPYSDLCVGVFFAPSQSSSSLSFATADTQCSSLTPMPRANTTQLISVHNQTELNCIGSVLQTAQPSKTCSSAKYHYLGYTYSTFTFFDGTLYSSVFSSPTIQLFQCLTLCYNSNGNGNLNFEGCNDFYTGNRYGAICDYRVY